MAEAKFNIYQEVTDRIIKQLENGVVPWHKPWGGVSNGAFNRFSKKPYSLLNQLLLEHDGEYATFKQWSGIGGKIKKGAKSEIVVFWKITKTEEEKDGKKVEKTIPLLRYYRVFHISQVEGVEPLSAENMVEHKPIEEAEKIKAGFVEREGIEIREIVTNDAFYSPVEDYIQVPCKEQYQDIAEFYSTLFHECIHATMSPSRLNRCNEVTKVAAFGSDDYSKEELVAELGSSFIMNHIGIESDKTFKNHAGYIKGWIEVLRNDIRFIVSAAGRAEKAANYVMHGKQAVKA